MNYKEGYDWGKQSLETAGVSEAELDARLFLEKICGTDRNTLLVHGDRLLSEEEKNRYQDWIQKRAQHIPLQHLTGEQEFMGAYLSGKRARAYSQAGYGNPCGRSDARNDGWEQDPGHVHRFRLYIAQPPSLFQ